VPPSSLSKAKGRIPRVFVVDDEPLIAQTVAAIPNMNGFDAVEALSGQAALEAARQIQPDIVLSDVLMPKMSGVELGIKIRQEYPAARVFLFSGQAATSELMRKAQAEGYSLRALPQTHPPRRTISQTPLPLTAHVRKRRVTHSSPVSA
jgi:CheY-like chemotaxis protein